MHDVHRIDVYAIFTQMIDKKEIKRNGKKEIATMYKDYTQLDEMKLIRALHPDSITK